MGPVQFLFVLKNGLANFIKWLALFHWPKKQYFLKLIDATEAPKFVQTVSGGITHMLKFHIQFS